MSEFDIIRAWKDPEYRASLSGSELAQLPENPAGVLELRDTDLSAVVGGEGPEPDATACNLSWSCCPGLTQCGGCWSAALTCGTYAQGC